MILAEFDKNLTSFLPGSVEGKRFLLAVSGGIDSMCMASLFLASSLKPEFGIATVNFKLRPGDCDLDQNLVREWAYVHQVPFHTIEFDTKAYAKEHSVSTQMAARDLRYGWFHKLLEEHHYDYIAVAHNMDDSAETMVLNLLRGTGVSGLAGIRSQNGRIIRPLITFSREAIAQYVNENGIPYRDDKTNFESHYSRNRVRNVIFPEFKKINPSFLSTLSRNSLHFVQAEGVLDEFLELKRGVLYREDGEVLFIDMAALSRERNRGYWLYRLLENRGFNSSQLLDIEEALSGQSGKRFSSSTHEMVVDRGFLKVYPLKMFDNIEFHIALPGVYKFAGTSFEISIFEKGESFNPIREDGVLYFDADSIVWPLVCRGWRPADRFRPFGMKGFKKLSDFFKDIKMDRVQKDMQPLICDGENIVCLPGLRIDDRYKIKTSTTMVAEVKLLK
jgi:tRNA(Ile)-lysidine synthase